MPTTASAPLSPLDMNRARSQHQPSAFPNQASKTDGADAIGANRHDKPSMGIAQPTSDGRAWNDAALVPSPSPSSTTTASSAIWTPPMNLPRARIDSKFPTDGLPLSRTAMAHAPSPNGDASRYHNPAITIDVPSERGGRGGSADVAPSARSSLSSWMPTSKRTARDDRSSVQSIRSIRSRISHHSPSPAPAEHAKRKDIQGEKDAEDADLEQCLPDPALLGVDDDDVDLPPNMESDERSAGVKLGNAGQSGSALKDREDDFAEALGTSSGKLTRTVTLLSSESDDPVSSPYNLFFGENVPSWIVHLTALMNGDKTNRWSRPLNFFLLAVLLLSILSLCLGTVASIASRLSQELFAVDTACIIVFTIEYLARVLVAQSAAELVSPMHLIDLVSIVPFWVELGIASHLGGGLVDRVTTTNGVSALRAMRLLRTFRLIKFIRRSAKVNRIAL
ncbi:hypothetical protein HK101_011157 [Irineochytrium annulatum]|nr:hypothetical protein HK101_011157 [Irineochytrium annulatum]